MIQLDYRDARPIYEQVRDNIRKLILSGAIKENEQLPSVRSLAASLAINPNTIKRAYDALEQEGYICSVPGKGCFASPLPEAGGQRKLELMDNFRKLYDELRLMGVSKNELLECLKEESDND